MGKLMLVSLGAVLAALALVACGDDGNSEDEDQITEAIEFAATSGDPKACTEVQTQRFTEQTAGGATGEAAVKRCQRDASDAPADSVEVSNIEIDGDSATAEAAFTGSFFDGQAITVGLVKEGDQWKIDEVTEFTEFDRDAFVAAFRETLPSEAQGSPEAVECAVREIQAQPDENVQGFIVGTDPEVAEEIFGPCSKLFPEE